MTDFEDKMEENGQGIDLEYPYSYEFEGEHLQKSETEFEGSIDYTIHGEFSGQYTYDSEVPI